MSIEFSFYLSYEKFSVYASHIIFMLWIRYGYLSIINLINDCLLHARNRVTFAFDIADFF